MNEREIRSQLQTDARDIPEGQILEYWFSQPAGLSLPGLRAWLSSAPVEFALAFNLTNGWQCISTAKPPEGFETELVSLRTASGLLAQLIATGNRLCVSDGWSKWLIVGRADRVAIGAEVADPSVIAQQHTQHKLRERYPVHAK